MQPERRAAKARRRRKRPPNWITAIGLSFGQKLFDRLFDSEFVGIEEAAMDRMKISLSIDQVGTRHGPDVISVGHHSGRVGSRGPQYQTWTTSFDRRTDS